MAGGAHGILERTHVARAVVDDGNEARAEGGAGGDGGTGGEEGEGQRREKSEERHLGLRLWEEVVVRQGGICREGDGEGGWSNRSDLGDGAVLANQWALQ